MVHDQEDPVDETVGRDEARATQPDGWMAEVNAHIKDASHQFVAAGGGFVAEVPERRLAGRFDGAGAHIATADDADAIRIRSMSFGRRDNGEPFEASPEPGECQEGVADPEGKCIQRLQYAGPGMTEWWVSKPDGFEQGWQIAERPDGVGPVRIDMQVDGADATVTEMGVWLQGDDGSLLIVSGLAAWDANGDDVDARFERTPEGFRRARA